jgi:hypothetical protein
MWHLPEEGLETAMHLAESANFTVSTLMKANVLVESSVFSSFFFKPTENLQKSPGFSQIDAAPFPPIYPFIFIFTFPGIHFTILSIQGVCSDQWIFSYFKSDTYIRNCMTLPVCT